jgi:Zn-dependent alcohol dehydrogenase
MTSNSISATVPATMRAAVLLGEDPRLTIMQIPVPRPRPGEALVRISSCGVCHTDLHVMRGEVSFPRPAVLGHEISGTIVEFGEGTSESADLAVGDVVVGAFIMPCTKCEACRAGRDDLCKAFFEQNRLNGTLYDGESRLHLPDGSFLAMYSMGGLAEYAVVPVSALTRMPGSLDATAASTLGCAAFTAYGAVTRAGRVQLGDSVAVVAVGGVGSSIVQMSRAMGASRVIAVDVTAEKLEGAKRLGATDLVNSRDADAVQQVRELTGGVCVAVAFEALGNPITFQQALGMLADGGRMVAVGISAGNTAAQVPITPLVRRGYTITGSFGARTRVDLPEVVRLAEQGDFNLDGLVTRRYSLADADAAYQALARGEITGRAVIDMSIQDLSKEKERQQ